MTFRYPFNIPATGSHKLQRFSVWAGQAAPDIAYSLPPQAPIKTETLTVRVKSEADRAHILDIFPATLP